MMNIKITCRAFFISVFLLIILLPSFSQVVVERSEEKVIISGTPYYVHLVKKGETAYSISKAYGITVEELTKENPPSVYGINEGQALRIPVREITDTPSVRSEPVRTRKDESKYIYHKLQPGETIYQLSKSYGVSENEIISSNSGRDVTKLPVGAEIAVPRREFMTDRQEFAVQEGNYIFHKVLRGESLSSIAEKYGLSVKDLRKENRNIRFPQVGDYLRIPVPKVAEIPLPEEMIADTAKIVSEEPVVILPRPAGYIPVRNLEGSFDVAVLLPFYLRENAVRTDIDSSKIVKGKKTYKLVSRSEDWIYPRSIGFIEMYQGILIAADTLRTLGLNINLHVFDIKNDTVELRRLIRKGSLAVMDLIIGPVYSSNLEIITDYARDLGIPVVSPVPLFNNSALTGNPGLFIANASLEVAQNRLARKLSEYYDKNIVFIHTDSAGVDPDVKRFKEKIITELSNRLPYEEIKFKEFMFFSRSAFDNDSINRLGHTLSYDTENIIVIATEDAPVISEALMNIFALSRKYNVNVFGYPAMRGLVNLDPKYFFDLDLLIYSPYWIDYSKKDVMHFSTIFRKKFLTEPGEMSYAWIGYDVAYYFLSGLAIHGNEFLIHPEIHNPDLLHTEFDFRRKSINDGFENQKLYPVRFTRDYEVKLASEVVTGQ
ncbi:MAG: LysM peptidoglycan-binding domain-containing protein [Bacteroidales bacterium]|jgi:LysM repeat protein|nr:LysM peptidoglycan-binding domain-containing protein [Bacteroidales bacterium]